MTNSTLQIILTIIGIMGSVGLFAGGIGFLWTKIKGGSKEARSENNDLLTSNDTIKQFYKEQNDDLKEINKVLGEKIEVLTREVGEIRGQLTAETKQKEAYYAIIQNRDPETKKFVELVMQFIDAQGKMNIETARILSEIHSYAKLEHERDFVVTSTISKDGDK